MPVMTHSPCASSNCNPHVQSMIQVDNAKGVLFNVVLYEGPTSRYGASPAVEFYDTRFPHTPFGQFVGSYSAGTLLGYHDVVNGIWLDSNTPAWSIGPEQEAKVLLWLTEEFGDNVASILESSSLNTVHDLEALKRKLAPWKERASAFVGPVDRTGCTYELRSIWQQEQSPCGPSARTLAGRTLHELVQISAQGQEAVVEFAFVKGDGGCPKWLTDSCRQRMEESMEAICFSPR